MSARVPLLIAVDHDARLIAFYRCDPLLRRLAYVLVGFGIEQVDACNIAFGSLCSV